MAEQEQGFVDGADDAGDVLRLVLHTVPLGDVGVSAAAARHGVHRELLREARLDELPVGAVVAETAVDQDERWPGAVALERDAYAMCRCQVSHGRSLPGRSEEHTSEL